METRLASKHDIPSDFTSQISVLELGDPCTSGSFGAVYRCTIDTSEGTKDVAVKALNIKPGRAVEKCKKAMRRELKVWLRLSNHPTIVPLLGTADIVGFPLPVLVSQWMPSGTLYMYLEQGTIAESAKIELVMGIANGINYLHSENVIHGDLHPANVLIDGSGHPRLIDFGLATVVGDAELQLNTTTAYGSFNPQWRAPEVIGIHSDEEDPVRPNFKSDMYSFGGVMFFIISGNTPWKEKKNPHQIIVELLKRATPARPNNIPDAYWNLIQQCWSWEPRDRPDATKVVDSLATKMAAVLSKIESTKRIIPPKAAPRTKHTELLGRHLPRRSKTIVIFGESGAGKSSLVNLIAGKKLAPTSPDMLRCTQKWTEYTISFDGDSYRVFDTVALDSVQLGSREYLKLVEDTCRSIKKFDNQGGIDLLLFCIRANRVTAAAQLNYQIFHESTCKKKVPIVLAITHLEREWRMEDWWEKNHAIFQRYQIQVAGHACITAADGLDARHRLYYNESHITIRNCIKQFSADCQKPASTGGARKFVL